LEVEAEWLRHELYGCLEREGSNRVSWHFSPIAILILPTAKLKPQNLHKNYVAEPQN
jgi:hypothetical protein